MSFVGWALPTGTPMPKIEVQWECLWPVPPRPVIPARSKRESILRFLGGDGKDGSPLKTARMTAGGFSAQAGLKMGCENGKLLFREPLGPPLEKGVRGIFKFFSLLNIPSVCCGDLYETLTLAGGE